MIYIYDIEVFVEDWIVVLRDAEHLEHAPIVIHNNKSKLKDIMSQKGLVLCGFNNKHYDDWIIQTMLNDGSNRQVKKHSDFIIEGGNGWEYPFIKGKRKPFKSVDLRDDLPVGLSLKAIEGNIGANIVESSVDFTIERKLTPEEVTEAIDYCKVDVDNTLRLFEIRKSYMDSKRAVARIKGMDEIDALSLTNAKLTARFLDAKRQTYDDEFVYTPPKELRIEKYKEPLEFFRTIDYKKKLTTKIAGVPHVYGWGGIHGARKNYFQKADSNYRIVTIDVGSYYPSMMLQYGFISRNIPSADGYKVVYDTRMKVKHTGDKETADALKLILNTCFGAMKNRFNDLYDPHNANAICITGMLLLTDLIEKLEMVSSFELIQSNTDGIIIRYRIEHENQVEAIVREWELRTRMNMEYTVIHAIAQKDVNNYVMKAGETYLVVEDEDGNLIHRVTEKDKGKLKSKGGYVSLFGGGDFKNNSMIVLHNALVNYFMDGIPVEQTIEQDNKISHYQMIAKTGSTYQGTFHEVNGERIPVQRVNRVYATKNPLYGTIYKRKNGKDTKAEIDSENKERNDKIASLPEHCVIDNENKMTIEQIDKSFYIELAKKRINDYLGIKEKKTKGKGKKMSQASLYTKLLELSRIMHRYDWEKDGKNMHQQYKYVSEAQYKNHFKRALDEVGLIWESNCVSYEFIPAISDKMHMVMATFKARITDPETKEHREYEFIGSGSDNGDKALYKAYTGGLKFFLANTFLVAEDNDPENDGIPIGVKTAVKKSNSPISQEQRAEIKKELTDSSGLATEIQKNSIKNGLIKLRLRYMNDNQEITDKVLQDKLEPEIEKMLHRLRSGATKADAEVILKDIRELMAA